MEVDAEVKSEVKSEVEVSPESESDSEVDGEVSGEVSEDPEVEVGGGQKQIKQDEPLTNGDAKSEEEEDLDEEADPDGWVDLLGSGRIRKRTLVQGDKERGRPKSGAEVWVEYKVEFEDKLVTEEKNYTFFLGESEVLQCIDLVTAVMNVGEQTEIISDPEFAFGCEGLADKGLPPKAAIRVFLTLTDFRSPPSPMERPFQEKMDIGKRKKQRGNVWFAKGDFQLAMHCYRKAVEYFDDEQFDFDVPIDRFSLEEILQDLLEERIKTLNNLAMCQIKLKSYDAALASIKQVLKIEPNNEKGLYRKSKILCAKHRDDEALGILRRLHRLYPENKQVKKDIADMTAQQKKNRAKEQKLSKKMLGLDKYENDETSKTGDWPSWKAVVGSGLILGSMGVAVAAAAMKFKWL